MSWINDPRKPESDSEGREDDLVEVGLGYEGGRDEREGDGPVEDGQPLLVVADRGEGHDDEGADGERHIHGKL